MSPAVRKVEASGHFVRVEWEDGSESRYPCVWLRDNCRCRLCFVRSAGARRLPLQDLDVDIAAREAALADGKKICITWPDGHTSEYEAEWLKKRCFSEEARAEMQADLFLPERQYWGSDLQLPKMPFEEILHNDESAYKWLCTLKKVGIVLLTGAAARQGELVKLGQRIGFLRLTFYGIFFDAVAYKIKDGAELAAFNTEDKEDIRGLLFGCQTGNCESVVEIIILE